MKDKPLLARLELLGINLNDLSPVLSKDPNYHLKIVEDKLSLQHTIEKYVVSVDFHSKKLKYRSQSHINAELVNKAVLGKKKQPTTILDCTAGFGKDAYLMSLTGSLITACESNTLMYALLKDGLNRTAINNITLHNKNALDEITKGQYRVIYADPMYPHSKKTAKNNKDMRFLQSFVGHQELMAEALFEKSMESTAQKLVIKRTVKADYVLGKKPTSQINGKAVRFDIYQLSGKSL